MVLLNNTSQNSKDQIEKTYSVLFSAYRRISDYISAERYDRKGEAVDYGNLGIVFQSIGQYDKAKEYLQMALVIRTEIGDKEGEAANLTNFRILSRTVGDYKVSEVCLEKALSISRDIGDRRRVFQILLEYAILYLFQTKITPFRVFISALECMRS